MSETRLLVAVVLLAALVLSVGPNCCAAVEKPSAERKIEAELEKPTELDVLETPLQDIVDFLKRRHGIEIQIDRRALDEVGLDPSTLPITKRLKGHT